MTQLNVLHGLDAWNIGGIQELVRLVGMNSAHRHSTWGYAGTMTPYLEEAGIRNFEGGPPAGEHFDVYVGHTVGGWSYDGAFDEMHRQGMKTVEVMHSNAHSPTSPGKADGFIALSHQARELNLDMPRPQTIYVPIDVASFRIPDYPEPTAIGRLSRLAEEKKPWQFAQLADSFPGERFLLAGDGPERERVTGRPNLQTLGWVRNFPNFYSQLKLFVFPTRDECCCASVAMAQAAGVVVICEDLPSLRETTGGQAVFCKDHNAFIVAIEAYLRQPQAEGWSRLRAEAQAWVSRYFDLPVTVGAWDAYLEAL